MLYSLVRSFKFSVTTGLICTHAQSHCSTVILFSLSIRLLRCFVCALRIYKLQSSYSSFRYNKYLLIYLLTYLLTYLTISVRLPGSPSWSQRMQSIPQTKGPEGQFNCGRVTPLLLLPVCK